MILFKKTIPMIFLAIGAIFSLSLSTVYTVAAEDTLSPTAVAASTSGSDPYDICDEISTSQFCTKKSSSLVELIKTGANVLLFLIGAIAVIMIIYSGFLYLTSMGDVSNVKRAKDTLVYSIIGLIVALLASAIVNFVLKSFETKSTTPVTTPTTTTPTTPTKPTTPTTPTAPVTTPATPTTPTEPTATTTKT